MSKEKEIKTNAMRILDREKIKYTTHFYDCEAFVDGMQIAHTLNQPVDQVYKTLVTMAKAGSYFVFVIPVAAELDLKKAAKAAGQKSLSMLPVKEINNVTGYIRGGCTAIGMKKQFSTFLDTAAENRSTLIVSGGRVGVQLELAPADFLKACKGSFADLK